MSAATAVAEPSAAAWEELARLAGRESGERAYLARLLDHWRSARGAAGAAFYACRDGACRRELVAGEGRFPEAVEGEPPEGFEALRLPEGLVLTPAGSGGAGVVSGGVAAAVAGSPGADAVGGAEPLTLLLAAASRCLALERRLKEQHFQVNYRGVELEALYDVGLAVASTLDLEELSEEVLVRAVSLLDARRGALYLREDREYRLDGTFGGAAIDAFPLDLPALESCLAGEGACPVELLPGARHLLLVPIESDRRRHGVLVVGDKESRRGIGPFGADDRRTLGLFANQAAIAIENARLHRQALEKERLEREMELAAEIQRQILPDELPEVAGWELIGWNRPARQVGGDYYDLVRVGEDGRIGFAIGDVTGKGMPAALLVSTLHSALTLLRDRGGLSPELVARLNRHVCESSLANKFITLVLGELDPANGRLTYINAGHNPGFLLRSGGGGGVERLDSTGLPLGLMAAGAWQARGAELAPGDLVCLYTDGITECAAPDDEELGEARLIGLLETHRAAPLSEVVAAIDRATLEHAAGLPQGDDQTLVLLRRAAG